MNPKTTLHALLALMMVTTLVPIGGSETAPAQAAAPNYFDAFRAQLAGNSGPKGDNNLQADFRVMNELQTFFYRDGNTLQYTNPGTCFDDPYPEQYVTLYDPAAANAPTVTPGAPPTTGPPADQSVTWTLTQAVARTEITSMTTTLFLQSEQAFTVNAQIMVNGTARGPPVPVRMSGAVPSQPPVPGGTGTLYQFIDTSNLESPQQVTGSLVFPGPVVIERGENIAIRLTAVPEGPAAEGADLEMQYNCAERRNSLVLGGDFARVAVWTENDDHDHDITFPAPGGAAVEDRGIVLRVAQVNALGEAALNRHIGLVQVVGPGPAGQLVYYDNTPATLGPGTPSAVTAGQGQRWAAVEDLPADPLAAATFPGARLLTFEMTYPDTLSSFGEYQVRVTGARGQAWLATAPLVVGGAGSALAPSLLDQATTKEILVGERTTFRVTVRNTNTAASDTLFLQPTVGNSPIGWSASASPSQLDLSPGASADAVITVVPASNGRAGDQNTVTLTATSLSSGAVSNAIVYTVKLTGTRQDAACLTTAASCFRVDSDQVNIGPGATRNVPFGIFNGGNAKDRYVLSLEGVPAGWGVSTNPSILEVEAQSLGASILRIQAPADAPRNLQFDVRVKVVRADDATKSDTFPFHVRVFPLQKFTFDVFSGSDVAGNPVYLGTTTVDAPLVHMLRDEGPDGDVRPAGCTVAGLPVCPPQFVIPASTAWDANNDPDTDYDQSTLFRLVLRNEGDLNDTIRVLPKLLTSNTGFAADLARTATGADARPALGYQDLDGCEDAANGDPVTDSLNDGWRLRILDPTQAFPEWPGSGGANTQTYNEVLAMQRDIVVPARSVRVLYVEMGFHLPTGPAPSDDCNAASNRVQGNVGGSRPGDPAPGHAIAIEAISTNDPSQRNTHVLNARIVDAGAPGTPPVRQASQRYDDQALGVALHIEDGALTGRDVTDGDATARTARYDLRAVNQANEMDTLVFTVPLNQSGWRYHFASIDRSLAFNNAPEGHGAGGRVAGCTTPAVQNPAAPPSNQLQFFECVMGAHDEVRFQVVATAPENGLLGTTNSVIVRATSKDSATRAVQISDTVQLATRLTGTHVFNLLPDTTPANAGIHPGQTMALPFTLRNLGTGSDRITMSLANAVPTGWQADFSTTNPVFVPAGRDVSGFLLVRAPASAATNHIETFRIQAQSMDSTAIPKPADFIDLKVQVAPDPTQLTVAGNPLNVVAAPGDIVPLKVNATKGGGTANTATQVTFGLDAASLPAGWQRVNASGGAETGGKAASFSTGGVAEQTFHVRIPGNAIGTSRAAIRFTGIDDRGISDFAYVGISLASGTVGVNLTAPGGTTVLVAPGSPQRIQLSVENLGVNQDTVNVTLGAVPTGWTAALDTGRVPLQPLQTGAFNLTVRSPANLTAGESRVIRVTARTGDLSQTDSVDLTFTTGNSVPILVPALNGTLRQAPLEAFRFTVSVKNNGTLPDDLLLGPGLTGAFKDVVKVAFTPAEVALQPGEGKDVQVEVTLPAGLAPGTDVPLVLEAKSKGPFLKAVGTATVPVKVLDYRVRDIEGDLVEEYAIDRDLDASNGFEEFRDPSTATGLSTPVAAESLLTEAAKARFTVVTTAPDGNSTSVVRFLFDPDGDLRTDLLVNTDNNTHPNVYWDPDRGYSHVIPLTGPGQLLKDVTKDGQADYFLDLDGEGGTILDVFYDPKEGRVGRLIPVDIDNNGDLDYVVDANGNGNPDTAETVLFGGPDGEIASIREMVNVDGKGGDDVVIDSNGDGRPDYFVPSGTTAGIPLVLEDVNGDGIEDWTWDSDNDGRRDAYYDPATGKTGFIDAQGDFFSELAKHWYIGALFGVVLVLFVVLLIVTRK